MNSLRTFKNGELKMLKTNFGELLPISEDLNDGCNREKEYKNGRYCFLSGIFFVLYLNYQILHY